MERPDGVYMAVLDRSGGSVGECTGSGFVRTSFGSVALDGGAGTAVVNGTSGTHLLAAQPGADVHAAILDKQTGEVLYERTVRL